jgi:hypothetical protein
MTTNLVDTHFITKCRDGKIRRKPVKLDYRDGRIWFLKSPFELKDEIKAMAGSYWHGRDTPAIKAWSIADCPRNDFQIEWLKGGNPYTPWEKDRLQLTFPEFGTKANGFLPLYDHQKQMVTNGLTTHYHIYAAEMGTGKTLAAIATMAMSGLKGWWWVGPKSTLYEIRLEFKRWGLDPDVVERVVGYEALTPLMTKWKPGDPAPPGVVFDEIHRLKTPGARRTVSAMQLTDAIRKEYGWNGYALGMTGTPSPKSPGDWWSPCEVIYPGFIKEGSRGSFEKRLGFWELKSLLSGQSFNTRLSWRDDENKCHFCGQYEDECTGEKHQYNPSVNEVALLSQRLDGIATFVFKKDCLNLPERKFKKIHLEPSDSMLRVAKAISKTAPNGMRALGLLRQLSDGFQYREIEDGTKKCDHCEDGTIEERFLATDPDAAIRSTNLLDPDFVEMLDTRVVKCPKCLGTQKMKKFRKVTKEVPCPKDDAVIECLEDQEEQGRIVIFAGFKGSLDRVVRVCQKHGWDTMRADGDGWLIEKLTPDGPERVKLDNPLEYWIAHENEKVAFCAHPKTGGTGLTLCDQQGRHGARVILYYSNDFETGVRTQSLDRIHRSGMLGEATVVDLIHLPTDERVLKVVSEDRRLELMSMGEIQEDYNEIDD